MSIHREILRLAVPSILANITIPLVGLVDTAIVGHISDASAIGGIAIGTMLFDLLYWNFGFLRVGTSGLTAQAYGREKTHPDSPHEGRGSEVGSLLFRSLRVALIGALACIAIQWLFVKGVLALVPCSAEVAAFAERYFFVRILAAPATLSLMALKGWFIGMQDTVSPMATDILVNVVNMLASYVLAVYTPLGGVGVAWGTLIAQYAGLVLAIGILGKKYQLTPSLRGPRKQRAVGCSCRGSWRGSYPLRNIFICPSATTSSATRTSAASRVMPMAVPSTWRVVCSVSPTQGRQWIWNFLISPM